MTESIEFTDEQLTAYLDREVDGSLDRLISTALDSDASLRNRLESMRIPIEDINQAFGDLLAAAPSMPELPKQAAPTAPIRKPNALVTMAACLALGLALGSVLTTWRGQPEGWKTYAAAYHSLYVNGTLAAVDTSQNDAHRLLVSLGGILKHDLSPAKTDPVLQFKRGQLLGYQGHALIQLAYLTPLGEPVALCITRAGDVRDSAVATTVLEGMAAAEWAQDGLAYLLIGGTDATLIQDAADRLAMRL